MIRKGQLGGKIFLIALLGLHSASFAAERRPVTVSPGEINLAQREQAAAVREAALAAQEEQLRQVREEIEGRLERLGILQREVAAKLAELQEVEDQRLRSLVKVYSSMKASKVAPLLDQMEDEAVVGILKAMKTETVAKIMPKLDRKKAVRISKQLGMLQ